MAFTTIVFKNPNTGKVKEAPVGMSWTVLFFGFLPALLRGDWKWAVIMCVLTILSAGMGLIVFMVIYNKIYIKGLIGAGYKAHSVSKGELGYVESKLGIDIPRIETNAFSA